MRGRARWGEKTDSALYARHVTILILMVFHEQTAIYKEYL